MCENVQIEESPAAVVNTTPTKRDPMRIRESVLFLPIVAGCIANAYTINTRLFHNDFSLVFVRDFYLLNALYLPLAFAIVSASMWVYLRVVGEAKKLQRVALGCLAISAVPLSLYGYATHYEPFNLKVKTVVIHSPKIEREIDIVHFTDTQSAVVCSYEERVFQTINSLEPDLVLFTGDLLQPHTPHPWDVEFKKMEALFQTLSPPLGTYLVACNTDEYPADLSNLPITVLSNEERRIPVGDTTISLWGLALDDAWDKKPPAAASWIERTDPNDFTILMGHYPNFVLGMPDYPVDLCLAGHTHGGQIYFPGIGVLDTACEIPGQWARGHRVVKGTHINISAGVGCERFAGLPRIRFLCPPDITLVQLRPSQ